LRILVGMSVNLGAIIYQKYLIKIKKSLICRIKDSGVTLVMSTWVKNVLSVVGPAEFVQRFCADAIGPQPVYTFGNWEPLSEPTIFAFSFNQIVPIPKNILNEPYDSIGISEELAIWGVKCGACTNNIKKHNFCRITYKFHTQNDFGKQFYISASKKYLNLYFFLSAKEDNAKRIRIIFYDGSAVLNSEWEYYSERKDCNEITKLNNWYNEYIDDSTHNEWVFLYSLRNGLDWNSFGEDYLENTQ